MKLPRFLLTFPFAYDTLKKEGGDFHEQEKSYFIVFRP